MHITEFEQDGLRYTFEPPIEVGELQIGSIHELAAIALLGIEASEDEKWGAMNDFADTLQSESLGRVAAFNSFLTGKYTVTGTKVCAGMPIWRSSSPPRGKVPGAKLSAQRARELEARLRKINEAQMAVRGNDVIVYPSS